MSERVEYQAVRPDGTPVQPGDEVTNFRGEKGRYDGVVRRPLRGKSGKVQVNGRTYFEEVWDLRLVPVCTEEQPAPPSEADVPFWAGIEWPDDLLAEEQR